MTDTGYGSTKREQEHMTERRTSGAHLSLPTRELSRHTRHDVRNSRLGRRSCRQASGDAGRTGADNRLNVGNK
jgi:hypothetical protein